MGRFAFVFAVAVSTVAWIAPGGVVYAEGGKRAKEGGVSGDTELMYRAMKKWRGDPPDAEKIERLAAESDKDAAETRRATKARGTAYWKDPFADEAHQIVPLAGRRARSAMENRGARREVSKVRTELAAAKAEAAIARAEAARARADSARAEAKAARAEAIAARRACVDANASWAREGRQSARSTLTNASLTKADESSEGEDDRSSITEVRRRPAARRRSPAARVAKRAAPEVAAQPKVEEIAAPAPPPTPPAPPPAEVSAAIDSHGIIVVPITPMPPPPKPARGPGRAR